MKALSLASCFPDVSDAVWWRILNLNTRLQKYFSSYALITMTKRKFALQSKEIPLHMYIVSGIDDLAELIKLMRSYDPDIVFINTIWPSLFGVLSKIINRRKALIIFDIHGIFQAEKELVKLNIIEASFTQFRENLAFKISDTFSVVSYGMQKYLSSQWGISKEKMIVVRNGIDLEFFNPLKVEEDVITELKKRMRIEGHFVIGYIGGMQKWQGVEAFVKAATCLRDRKDLVFLIVGGSTSLRSGNIIKIPFQPRELLPLYYSICDAYVLPRPFHATNFVAMPTKFAEYCAMAKPIVATTAVLDVALLLKNYGTGLLVSKYDPRVLASAFKELAELPESELREMGLSARRLAERVFNWETIVQQLYNFLKIKVEERN